MKEWIIGLITAGWVFFTPVHTAVIGIFLMVFTDLLTGMWAAYKRGDKIESKKMRTSIGKFIAYLSLILISYIFDTHFIIPFMGTTLFFKFITFLIGAIEFKSLIENFEKILNIPNLWEKIKEFLAQNRR